jgi:hypothetical protein
MDFGNDLRNVQFALSTDGMNPFGKRSSTHSTWPVILIMYNQPTVDEAAHIVIWMRPR